MPAPTVTPLNLDPSELTIRTDPADRTPTDPVHEQEIERRWADACAANPRLFNGPILAYQGFDPGTNTVRAHLSDYKRLAVQREFESREPHGTTILSVTGVLTATAHDGATTGTRCVCVAQRSHSTRVYGGQWELAPSGGIDPPQLGAPGTFDGSLAATALRAEIKEELGLNPETRIDRTRGRVLGLVLDERSGSLDVLFHVEHVPRLSAQNTPVPVAVGPWPRHAGSSWEYEAISWVPIDGLAGFVRTNPCIGPMVETVEAGLLVGL